MGDKKIKYLLLSFIFFSCVSKGTIGLTSEEYEKFKAFKTFTESIQVGDTYSDLVKRFGKPYKYRKPDAYIDLEKQAEMEMVYFSPFNATISACIYLKGEKVIGCRIVDWLGTTNPQPRYFTVEEYWSEYENFDDNYVE